MNVLGIAGSLRKESFNRRLLLCAGSVARTLGEEMRIHDLAEVPLYNADVEKAGMPDGVAKLRADLEWADCVVIATPEYNNSIPGVLKNAIDWASTSGNKWDGKVVALIGATVGAFGTIQAQAHLRHIMLILNAIVVPTPFVYVPKAQEAFNPDGSLANEMAAKNLEALIRRLFTVTGALKRAQ
jgi:chromate reductase